jgi:hypothetical protein
MNIDDFTLFFNMMSRATIYIFIISSVIVMMIERFKK